MPTLAELKELDRKHRETGKKIRAAIATVAGPRSAADAAAFHSAQTAARQSAQTALANELGLPDPPKNPRRKKAARQSLLKFLTTYFPESTGLKPFGPDHRRIIASMERCIRDGGRLVNAVYRGFAKTTIAENAAIWAALFGYRQFVLVTAINMAASSKMIDSIKTEIAENELLAEDFPEVCQYIRALHGKPQKAAYQTCQGEPTRIQWTAGTIVLPTIPGSPASGAIIVAKPYAKARGSTFKQADGKQVRPDLAINDDPQDDESAATALQVNKNLNVLHKVILQSAGHGMRMACIVNGTVIAKDDMLESLLADPAWQGVRVPMVKQWATAHEVFWLKGYAGVRRDFDRSVPGDQDRAHVAATALYRKRRQEADAGCLVSWAHIPRHPGEVSAVQHAYNILIDDGEAVFASEYQQVPMEEADAGRKLSAAAVAAKCNGLARGAVPLECSAVVASIDVHDRLLYWGVIALADGFRGAVLDWGQWPPQPSSFFSLVNCPHPLEDAYPGRVQDAYILAGLTEATDRLLARQFVREDGAPLRIGKLLIDAHWGEKTELVKSFCRRHPQFNAVVLPSFGVGVRPGDSLRVGKKPGGRFGPGWGSPPAEKGMLHVTFDADWAKSQVAQRLAVPLGTPGGWDLWGDNPRTHAMLAEHCTAERAVQLTRGEATKETWELLPNRDNHGWDNLVMCLIAGLVLGVKMPDVDRPSRRRGRSTTADGRLPTMAELSAAAKSRKGAA